MHSASGSMSRPIFSFFIMFRIFPKFQLGWVKLCSNHLLDAVMISFCIEWLSIMWPRLRQVKRAGKVCVSLTKGLRVGETLKGSNRLNGCWPPYDEHNSLSIDDTIFSLWLYFQLSFFTFKKMEWFRFPFRISQEVGKTWNQLLWMNGLIVENKNLLMNILGFTAGGWLLSRKEKIPGKPHLLHLVLAKAESLHQFEEQSE